MFTGLVEATGKLKSSRQKSTGGLLEFGTEEVLPDLDSGASVSVNGVCLTVTRLTKTGFTVDVSPETRRRTNLAQLRVGDMVNLERALEAGSRLGGHMVTGHVDGVGKIVSKVREGNSDVIQVKFPQDLGGEIVARGSIAVDGISLTVTGLLGNTFSCSIVPYTARHTTLGRVRPGQRVNLETDLIAKYVRKMVEKYSIGERGILNGIGVD